MAERARFTEVTPGDPEVPRGNRRFRRQPAEPPREMPKMFTDPDAWPNKLPPLPTRGEMLVEALASTVAGVLVLAVPTAIVTGTIRLVWRTGRR